MNSIIDLDTWLGSDCEPMAVYFSDADCVEYISEDTTTVYRRVDEILTLIYDETCVIPIGFKLKGFKVVLETIRDELQLDDDGFVALVSILESVMTKIGDELHESIATDYAAATKIAGAARFDIKLAA